MNQLIIDFNSLSLDEKLLIIHENILSVHQSDDRMKHVEDMVLSAKGYESNVYFFD